MHSKIRRNRSKVPVPGGATSSEPICARASAHETHLDNCAGSQRPCARVSQAVVGTIRERIEVMDSMQTTPESSASDQDLRPRARTLSWMASMSVAAGELRAAEGYLLELLAWCAFAEREGSDETADHGI